MLVNIMEKEKPMFVQQLLNEKYIGNTAICLMLRLVQNADENGVVRGVKTIELKDSINITEKTFRAARGRLEKAGLMVMTKEKRNGCNLKSCVYTIEQNFFKQITEGDRNE